jgi:penicillin amidase
MLKKLIYALLALFVVFTSAHIYFNYATHTPKVGARHLDGLRGKVIVQRDQYGVPHINALSDDNDAYFALGYVHAQDRFWQMEFQRRVTQGTLSEIFGIKALDKDKFLRTWGFYRAAASAWPSFDHHTQAIVRSYTAGVNAFLTHGKLPLQIRLLRYQPKPWTNIDSIAWQKMMAFDLQDSWAEKIKYFQVAKQVGVNQIPVLLPPYPKHAPTILSANDLKHIIQNSHATVTAEKNLVTPQLFTQLSNLQTHITDIRNELGFRAEPMTGSNNWVTAGKLNSSGKPLLANDPHLAIATPIIWYLAELRGPHLHSIGATIPGLPGVIIGHNASIAWGVTNALPDTQDLYIEPAHTPLTLRHEIIKVKNHDDVELIVRSSRHGPIISDVIPEKDKLPPQIALKWTALGSHDTTLQSFVKINAAQNWKEFTDALRDYVVPSQHFVYADIHNNIGYYLPGEIPIREGWDGSFPVGPNEHHEWAGFIPFEELPHVFNPRENYIASANNKATPDNYPYSLTFRWREPPYRIERIVDLLATSRPFDIDAFKKIQLDTRSYLWRELKPLLMQTKPLDAESKRALKILADWDGDATEESVGTTVFSFWYRELTLMPIAKLKFASYWQEPLFIAQQLRDNGNYCRSPQTKTCGPYLSETLQHAVSKLSEQAGEDPRHWQWGHFHRAYFEELGLGGVKSLGWIWNRHIATAGSDYTVNVGAYRLDTLHQFKTASYRQIIDVSNFDKSVFIEGFGQTENALDTTYADLLTLWRDGKYIPMSSRREDWGKIHELVLAP